MAISPPPFAFKSQVRPSLTVIDVIDPTSLADIPVPERQWLIRGWIPMARVTALYGAAGKGKTLLAQMLATACALESQDWLGLQVRQCRSLLFFAEDDRDEMHARQADINAFYGCSFSDLGAMVWVPRLGEDCELMTFEGARAIRAPLFDQILNISREHSAQLIVTDTLSDTFGGNENRVQVRRFGHWRSVISQTPPAPPSWRPRTRLYRA